MARAFYSRSISEFLEDEPTLILGEMSRNNPFDLTDLQKYAWEEEISILKTELSGFHEGRILFEYTIPRMGKRVDVVLLLSGIVFLLEFKVGEKDYKGNALAQVLDYALDLKNFQSTCKDLLIAPVFIPTEASESSINYNEYEDHILHPMGISKGQINSFLKTTVERYPSEAIDHDEWENGVYMPSPTIIEAAQALYCNHSVAEISRSDAGAQNLTATTTAIKEIIRYSKDNNRKAIIFVTGVPGAGKTLVGLNLASEFHNNDEGEHAVFLSGNGPLVEVLQEALSRDKIQREKERGLKIRKEDAQREIESFIQIIHHYRDEYVGNSIVPTEHVAIFDESQRAWTKEEISSFMLKKKGIRDFDYSEPEFLISTMNRLPDWGVIVCLVGGGQEINRGEAGMPEWFDSLRRSFSEWDVYSSDNIQDSEYIRERSWESLTTGLNLHTYNSLHLASSMRSFRSEKVAAFVKALLDHNTKEAKELFEEISDQYPIVLSRDLEKAKDWC